MPPPLLFLLLVYELQCLYVVIIYPLCYVVVWAPYYTTHPLVTLVTYHLSLERSHYVQTHIFVTYFHCSVSTVNIVACLYPYVCPVCPLMWLFSLPSFYYTSFEQNAAKSRLISIVLHFLTSITRIGIFMWCGCMVCLLKQHNSHKTFVSIFWLHVDKNEPLRKGSVVWQ
jgi:hypothetical protein